MAPWLKAQTAPPQAKTTADIIIAEITGETALLLEVVFSLKSGSPLNKKGVGESLGKLNQPDVVHACGAVDLHVDCGARCEGYS